MDKNDPKLQDAIKSRYLGGQREKRKRGMLNRLRSVFSPTLMCACLIGRRLHERKFIFDWDASGNALAYRQHLGTELF